MASPQITDASLVAARQSINEHYIAENPHDITPEKINASPSGHSHTVDHNNIQNKGSNTHEQIDAKITAVDTHLSSTNNPHGTTATQVGALAVTDTLQSVSFDTLTTRGVYLTAAAQTNAPNATDSFILEVFKFSVSTGILQRATAWKSAGNVYTRWYNGTTWSAWTQIYPQPYI